MFNFLFQKTIKWGTITPIITRIAPEIFVQVIFSSRKITAKIKPKGIINTRSKLAIPTGMFLKALLYKKKGKAKEKIKNNKVINVPEDALNVSVISPKNNMYKVKNTEAEIIWLIVT